MSKKTGIKDTIMDVVRAMDKVIDNTIYPLPEQKEAAESKRRLGLGVTGLANYVETEFNCQYGSDEFLEHTESVLQELTWGAYRASIQLAKEKGPFPMFNKEKYLQSFFVQSLPKDIQEGIAEYGVRNSHLISFAPTGTISLTAGNVSSGIEPVFSHEYTRTIKSNGLDVTVQIKDYAYDVWGTKGRTANQCSVDDHLNVLALATKYSDSAVSKTVNVGDDVSWEDFKNIYRRAWEMGCKGVTTFRAAGKRFGILNEGTACFYDPETGQKECS